MVLKQLNKILLLISILISNLFMSQIKFADMNKKKFKINIAKEKKNLVKIFNSNKYSVYYLFNKGDFSNQFNGTTKANLIFFSKTEKKGIFIYLNYGQNIYYIKKNVFDVVLNVEKINLIPNMILLDGNFNYEYLLNYYNIQPSKTNTEKIGFNVQEIDDYCNSRDYTLTEEMINSDLKNILYISLHKQTATNICTPIFDLKLFFPPSISKITK